MKTKKYIIIKLYLRCKHRPFVIELESEKQIDDLLTMIETQKIVKFGLISFKSDDFKYIIEE